ncbi:MAG: hypothetical protein AAFN77_18200 [Planctomycetota bacterium]
MAVQNPFIVICDQNAHLIHGSRVESIECEPNRFEIKQAIGKLLQISDASLLKNAWGLGLPSVFFYCLNGRVASEDGGKLMELKYNLEEHLPLDAEEMAVAHFSIGKMATTFVLDTKQTDELLADIYEEHGVRFNRIFPSKLLIGLHGLTGDAHEGCLVADVDSCDLVTVDQGRVNWLYFPGSLMSEDCDQQWHVSSIDDNCSLDPTEPNASPKDLLMGSFGASRSAVDTQQVNCAEQANQSAGIGEATQSVLDYLLVSVAVAILFVTVGLVWRASLLRSATVEIDQSIRSQYRELFPGERINAPIDRLLDGQLELAKSTNQMVEISNDTSRVLGSFATIFESLPPGMNFTVDSIEVYPGRISVAGSVTTLGDLDALRKRMISCGYEIGIESRYAKNFTLVLMERDTSLRAVASKGETP